MHHPPLLVVHCTLAGPHVCSPMGPAVQGKLEASHRAQRDHQDAAQAARLRYNELIVTLRDRPEDIAEVHTGWMRLD